MCDLNHMLLSRRTNALSNDTIFKIMLPSIVKIPLYQAWAEAMNVGQKPLMCVLSHSKQLLFYLLLGR